MTDRPTDTQAVSLTPPEGEATTVPTGEEAQKLPEETGAMDGASEPCDAPTEGDVPIAQDMPTEGSIPTKADTATTVDYAALEAEDIAALRAQFPELSHLSSLRALKNPTRYGELRDLGLSAVEAYLATEGTRAHAADTRAHLHSAMPRTLRSSGEGISPAELAAARELFGHLTDHEIRKLYKRVMG